MIRQTGGDDLIGVSGSESGSSSDETTRSSSISAGEALMKERNDSVLCLADGGRRDSLILRDVKNSPRFEVADIGRSSTRTHGDDWSEMTGDGVTDEGWELGNFVAIVTVAT